MNPSDAELFVSVQEFIGAAESFASSCLAAGSLPKHIEADVIKRLHSEMTILTAVSAQVARLVTEGEYGDVESMTKVNQGVQYVRLLQALGLDVRNMPESAISGDEFAVALESFSTSAAAVSKLIRNAGF